MGVSTATETLQALGLGQPSTAKSAKSDLGQDDFLTLMMTQLKSQDPMKPMDSTDLLSQLAQFSTVNGIDTLNKSFATLSGSLTSGQVLQASQMVGRSALVPGSGVALDPASGLKATVDLPALVPDLTLNLYDASGQLVRSLTMEGQGPGLVDVKFDGLDDSGEALPAGQYRLEATGSYQGQTQAFETLTLKRVEGVTVDPEGGQPLLEMAGGGTIALNKVREIR